MESRDLIIEDLVALILRQDREIRKLKEKIKLISQYIETYEEFIKGDR